MTRTIDRREFLRRAALVAAGAVAVDQLELLDRLGWVRRLFPGWSAPGPVALEPGLYHLTDGAHGMTVTRAQWDALLKECYLEPVLSALNVESPLLSQMRRRQPRSLLHSAPVWRVDL